MEERTAVYQRKPFPFHTIIMIIIIITTIICWKADAVPKKSCSHKKPVYILVTMSGKTRDQETTRGSASVWSQVKQWEPINWRWYGGEWLNVAVNTRFKVSRVLRLGTGESRVDWGGREGVCLYVQGIQCIHVCVWSVNVDMIPTVLTCITVT